MQSLRKLVKKPRVDDWSPLAKFYYADEALNAVASELDSFDGRRDPDRCNQLVNKLRQAQDRVLHIISEMLVSVFTHECDRASRDFRIKFPDEIVHENLPGQLWFGAECLAAGSNIIDHEAESEAIRPMARALTRHLDQLRELLKDQSLRDPLVYSDKIKKSLRVFDHLFAEFELNYVSAMVPVKSVREYDCQLDVAVLFSETLMRAIKIGYVTQEQIENCDPNVMITIPRLAIVAGLYFFPYGALDVDGPPDALSDMFRPFQSLLCKIRDLLFAIDANELQSLEMALCSGDRPLIDAQQSSAATLTMSAFRSKKQQQESVPMSAVIEDDADSSHSNDAVCIDQESIQSIAAHIDDTSAADINQMVIDSPPIVTMPDDMMMTGTREMSASRKEELRSRFRSSQDLVHRLFVCIAGVADQLQTNYPSDVRKVLKMILQPNEVVPVFEVNGRTADNPENEEEETGIEVQEALPLPSFIGVRWVPDSDCEQCTACESAFTIVRRRHHCRNCGRIFCGRCSSNALPLPELGYQRKVRVCNLCFLYKLNPFSTPPPSTSDRPCPTDDDETSTTTAH